jgi:protein disulfide-isomerase
MRTLLRALAPATLLLAATASFAGEGWLTSYDQAVKLSKKTGKPILMDFTGTDWCTFCNRLNKEVFKQKEFKTWAASKVILLTLDFPQKKALPAPLTKQNKMLAAKYKVTAWPTILFVAPSGKELGRTGYAKGGPSVWLKTADQIVAKKARLRPTR